MKNKTILIVDDMAFDRLLLSKALTKKLKCKIVEAATGKEALKLITNHDIDLVLLDVTMPGLKGHEVVIKMREGFSQSALPIIMVSGNAEDASIIECLKAGANDYITKPVKLEVAITRIICQLRWSSSIKDQLKIQELETTNAMVATYHHDINNPLTVAIACLSKLEKNRNDDAALKKVEVALQKITQVVRKIKEVTSLNEAPYESRPGIRKKIKTI